MAKLNERKNFSFTEEESRKLEELARANTSGNEAMLVRSLINRAYMMPGEFGLLPPVAVSKDTLP